MSCKPQAALKVWRYGNMQNHVEHLDTDLHSVVATVIVFLSDSGTTLSVQLSRPVRITCVP